MEDNFEWMGYEWLTHERWGMIHPANPIAWHDPNAIKIDDDGYLRLYTRHNPMQFDLEGQVVGPQVGIGLVSCTKQFGYGYFEIEAKLPSGPYLWPAFWMWAFDSWPPEIDVFEGYTNKKSSYFNWNWDMLIGRFWRTPSNIHLGVSPDNYNLGAKEHVLGWKSPAKRFYKYGVHWKKDEIRIIFNERCVRKITDEKVLSQFRGKKMNVIINTGIQREHLDTAMDSTEMIVKNFKYWAY